METIVFLDAQNAYKGAREAFGWTDRAGRYGNFRPITLSRLIYANGDPLRRLKQVRIYTGVPSNERDSSGYQATQRRIATWKAEGRGLVEVVDRTLQYSPTERPREKGINVLIAIDMVRMAIRDEYDAVVLISGDTDLVPALEFVADLKGSDRVASAMWKPSAPHLQPPQPLGVAVTAERAQILRWLIDESTFAKAADKRDYRQPIEPITGPDGRRLPPGRR